MIMRLAIRVAIAGGGAILGLTDVGRSQELGPEFAVASSASEYVVAADAGGFIVAWKAEASSAKRLYLRRFAPNGAALGGAVLLGGADSGAPQSLAATSVGNGGYVVAWIRRSQGSDRIVARRVGPEGIGRLKDLGAAVQGLGSGLALAGLGDGEWASAVAYARPVAPFGFGGIWLTLRSASGAPRRAVRVTSSGFTPALAANGKGALLAAYRTARPGDPETIRIQLHGDAGRKLAAATVTSTESDISSTPQLASDGRGRFVVGWVQSQTLWLRFFEAPTKAIGAPFETGSEANWAAVAMEQAGSVLAAFSLATEFYEAPILGRAFDRDGAPAGEDFQIAIGNGPPVAAALGNGRFVVVWPQGDALRARIIRW
jgi:hypothetical protein